MPILALCCRWPVWGEGGAMFDVLMVLADASKVSPGEKCASQ